MKKTTLLLIIGCTLSGCTDTYQSYVEYKKTTAETKKIWADIHKGLDKRIADTRKLAQGIDTLDLSLKKELVEMRKLLETAKAFNNSTDN